MSPMPVNGVRTTLLAALQSPQQPIDSDGVPLFTPNKPDEFRLGVLTFLPPDIPGQFVSVRVPVGALVSRVGHSIAAAQHRRAESTARDEVAKALALKKLREARD